MTEYREQPTVIVQKGPNSFQSCISFVGYGILGLIALSVLNTLTSCDTSPAEGSSIAQTITPSAGQTPKPGEEAECGTMIDEIVTVDALAAAYEANEAAAQRDYGDRCVAIEGVIEKITLNIVDEPTVYVSSGEGDTTAINLADQAFPLAADFYKGQRALFICASVSEFLGDPVLGDCVFAYASPADSR